jgi:hypothetical protein
MRGDYVKIIEINALQNGAHRNQEGSFNIIPDGWAVIPDSIAIPASFPGVDIKVRDGVVVEMVENAKYIADLQAHIKKAEREGRISELKQLLLETDYKAIKYAEGLISDEEYAVIRSERQAWREEINALEAELEGLHD